jgi:ribosome-associated protein
VHDAHLPACDRRTEAAASVPTPTAAGPGVVGYHAGMTTPTPIDDVRIGGDAIRLGQFLKFAGLLDSGGEVKEAIIDGYVLVNGEVDRRRGRQLQLGDIVSFEGRSVRVCP